MPQLHFSDRLLDERRDVDAARSFGQENQTGQGNENGAAGFYYKADTIDG